LSLSISSASILKSIRMYFFFDLYFEAAVEEVAFIIRDVYVDERPELTNRSA